MKTVLLPEPIRPEGRRLLEGRVRIVETPDHKPDTLKKSIRDAHGVILRTGARITAEMIAGAPHLQVIARTGGGVDNVDVKAATERGICVCHVPDANVISVAEHVITLLLALSKQLKILDEEARRGNFAIRYQYLSTELTGKTLGIIGLGKIGREVAERARKGLGMKVVTFDPYVEAQEASRFGAEPYDSLKKMLTQSDAVTLHVPLAEKTRKLMGADEFRSMKPSAWFINTSRGALVDEAALIQALDSGVIAGAGLDVFESEPLAPDSPLTGFSNVILTPHVAGLTNESSIRMAVSAAEAVLDVLEGRTPAHVFNRDELMER
jgi:D-3-phosphoglycerate dehydrogenase